MAIDLEECQRCSRSLLYDTLCFSCSNDVESSCTFSLHVAYSTGCPRRMLVIWTGNSLRVGGVFSTPQWWGMGSPGFGTGQYRL